MRTFKARATFYGRLLFAFCYVFFHHVVCTAEPRTVRSLLEIRQQQVVIQKFDLSCGAAALATLLRFQYGEKISEHDVAAGLMQRDDYLTDPDLIRQRQGFSLLDLKRFVERRGYHGTGYGGMQLDDLIRQAPVMVPLNLHGYQHFVIFRGVVSNRIALADPAWGNRTLPIDDFLQSWIDDPQIGRVGFVIEPRDNREIDNRLAPRADDLLLLK